MTEITYTESTEATGAQIVSCGVTVTDLTGYTSDHHFARITTASAFADQYAPVLITFCMTCSGLPELPQIFAVSTDEARKITDAVGALYADAYTRRMHDLRAQIKAETAAARAAYDLPA